MNGRTVPIIITVLLAFIALGGAYASMIAGNYFSEITTSIREVRHSTQNMRVIIIGNDKDLERIGIRQDKQEIRIDALEHNK